MLRQSVIGAQAKQLEEFAQPILQYHFRKGMQNNNIMVIHPILITSTEFGVGILGCFDSLLILKLNLGSSTTVCGSVYVIKRSPSPVLEQ
jgi:hypothetical protein